MSAFPTDAEMAQFRVDAEAGMLDTCIITRPDPDAEPGVMDPDTMQYPEAEPLTVYEGKCRVQIKAIVAGASDTDVGDREVTAQEFELQIPVTGTEVVAVRDTVTIVTAALDDSLTERVFTIKARHEKTHATARRLRIEEVTG